MADFNKNIDLDKGLNQILDKIDRAADRLQKEGRETWESFDDGWDDGLNATVDKIKASAIKTDKAFKNLGDKIKKQVQQLTTTINGKDTRIKIDFSDIDLNSDDIKKQVERKVKSIKVSDLIDFDTKGFDGQLTNFVTLFMKYKGKLSSLQQAYPNITVPKDAQNNLQQQLALATELDKMFRLLNGHGELFTGINLGALRKDLSKLQQFSNVDTTKVVGEYDELSKVLKEIQGSLKVISDTFKNENNSMKAMADNGKTSFESLSQAIVEVYNNLAQVKGLVDNISQKDFNITNITQTGGSTSNLQSLTKQMAVARETMEHLRQLYDQAGDTVQGLAKKGQMDKVLESQKQLAEFDLNAIAKSVQGANTEMKLASVLAEMQDYIDKFIQINELRNKFDLGGWKDTFVPTQKSVVKPTTQSKQQVVETPIVAIPQNTMATSNAEAQQMWQLKAAVDEVSNAIGRKNAGFIKEKEIVDASVDAEKTKLRELVDVITNEIGNTLDGIKVKFGEALTVPELNKGNLQASFDEIYNKFVELKGKIQTMQIDVGINTTNITNAIQEALYAEKFIKAGYRKATFGDMFGMDLFNMGRDNYVNKLTGEAISGSDAQAEFDAYGKDMWVSQLGQMFNNINEVIQDMATKTQKNIEPEQNNWTQVIVEAINTQGGKIVESIKLLLPKNITDNVDESKLISAFDTLTKAIQDYMTVFSGNTKSFFNGIKTGYTGLDSDSIEALNTLGLMTNGKPTFDIASIGGINEGTIIGDKFVLSTQSNTSYSVPDIAALMAKQNKVYEAGGAVPRIISGFEDNDGNVFQLQTRAPGVNHRKPDSEMTNASPEQIDRLLYTFDKLIEVGLYPEFGGDNVMYDPKDGFTVIDLDLKDRHREGLNNPDNMVEAFLRSARITQGGDYDDRKQFESLVRQRYALAPEDRLVNAETIAAERAAQQSSQVPGTNAKITPTMDEGAVAKVVADNVAKTPATVKVTPVIDSASDSAQAIGGEGQEAIDVAKQFVDAANAKLKFVEANKQVAQSAEESAESVAKESEAAEEAKKVMEAVGDSVAQPDDWDKKKQVLPDYGKDPLAEQKVKTITTDDAFKTITENWRAIRDEDGKLTGEMELDTVTIINDYRKRTEAITKENEKIKTAQAYLQKFLTQFDNKTMNEGSKLRGYEELSKLAVSPDFKIEDIARAEQMMSNLDAEYNKVVQSIRKGTSSMNPFVNAINNMGKMEDMLRNIQLQYQGLDKQPQWLGDSIIDLYKRFDNLSGETDIYKFAEGFGNLKVAINSVTESIRQQRAEQKITFKADNLRGSVFVEASKMDVSLQKWREQGVLTEDIKNKIDALAQSLWNVTSSSDLTLWKKQWQELSNIMKVANMEAKNAEQGRKAQVSQFADLIKLRNSYQVKGAKEDQNSSMQLFYSEQEAKVQARINELAKQINLTEQEQNALKEIQLNKARQIAEIEAKRQQAAVDKANFVPQDKNIQEKYNAGYLSEGLKLQWEQELVEYQNYMNGIDKVDQTTIDHKKQSLTQLYDKLTKMGNATKTFFASGGEILPQWMNVEQINNAQQSLESLYQSIASERFAGMETKITGFSGANEQIKRLTFTVDDGQGSLTQYALALNTVTGATKLVTQSSKPVLTVLQQIGSDLKKSARGVFSAFIGGTSVLYTFGRYIKEGIQAVRELDGALTELKKVTDETEETYDRFLYTAAQTGASIGRTITEVTSATAEFAKLGYSVQMAASMAEAALVYTNVGDNMDVETASQSIISTMKAFGMEANNTMSIVDKFNEVGELIARR